MLKSIFIPVLVQQSEYRVVKSWPESLLVSVGYMGTLLLYDISINTIITINPRRKVTAGCYKALVCRVVPSTVNFLNTVLAFFPNIRLLLPVLGLSIQVFIPSPAGWSLRED